MRTTFILSAEGAETMKDYEGRKVVFLPNKAKNPFSSLLLESNGPEYILREKAMSLAKKIEATTRKVVTIDCQRGSFDQAHLAKIISSSIEDGFFTEKYLCSDIVKKEKEEKDYDDDAAMEAAAEAFARAIENRKGKDDSKMAKGLTKGTVVTDTAEPDRLQDSNGQFLFFAM